MSVDICAREDRGRRSRALPGGSLTHDRPGAYEKKGAHGGNMVSPVMKGIQGNICRSTGYVNIVEAIKAVGA